MRTCERVYQSTDSRLSPQSIWSTLTGTTAMLPPTPGKLWGARDLALEGLRIGLKQRGSGPVTEVVTSDVRLPGVA